MHDDYSMFSSPACLESRNLLRFILSKFENYTPSKRVDSYNPSWRTSEDDKQAFYSRIWKEIL